MRRRGTGEIAIWCFLAVVGLGVVAGVLGLLVPRFPMRDELLATIGLLAAYTLAGPVIVVAFRKRSRALAAACVVPLGLSLLLWLALVWFGGPMSWRVEDLITRWGGTLLICAAAVLYFGLVRLPAGVPGAARGFGVGGLSVVGIAGAMLAAWLSLGMIWVEAIRTDWFGRLTGVCTVIAIGALFAVFAIAGLAFVRARREGDSALGDPAAVRVALTCPRCGVLCDLAANRPQRCGACNLRLRVEVQEPRCACGYLLHHLQSETCPECGRAVPTAERWGGVVTNEAVKRAEAR